MSGISEKVTIPHAVAEAIEHYRETSNFGNDAMLRFIGSDYACFSTKCAKVLADYSNEQPTTYAKAILDGYEIEQSPEERLRERFITAASWAKDGDNYARGVVSGVKETLNILGITIEGIND